MANLDPAYGKGTGGGGGATTFDGLSDTPASKAGNAGKVPAVNAGETALEYITPSGGTTDNTTDGNVPVKQSGAFENSSISEDATNVNSTKPIIAPNISVNAGSIDVGNQKLSAAGENFKFTNKADDDVFYPVWIEEGSSVATARFPVGSEQSITVEPSKVDILINPVWNFMPATDTRIIKATFEVDTTITNVTGIVDRNGEEFYRAKLGTLTANVETEIPLDPTTGNVSAEAFGGITYQFRLESADGDVRAKGSTANMLPFSIFGFFNFIDEKVLTESDLSNNQIIRSGVKGDFSIASQTADTEVAVTADVGIDFSVHFNLNPIVDNQDGFEVAIPNSVIPVTNSVTAAVYYVSVNSSGTFFTELTKAPQTSIDRVHLYEYAAVNGALFPATLVANPYLSYTDRTLSAILESDGERVNGLDISSTDDLTLGIKTSDFDAIANSINYVNSKISPHIKPISGTDPLNFTYLLQTNTPPPPIGVDVLLDPTLYDNAGVATGVGANQATVQLIMLFGDDFGILRGQTLFNNYDDALLNINTTNFIIPPALTGAIEVGRIVLKGSATDSADVDEVTIQSGVGGVATGGSGNSGFVTRSLIAPAFFDARFFGELGLPDAQNPAWTLTATSVAAITVESDTVRGVPQDVIKFFDDGGGIASALLALDAQDIADFFTWDASFSGDIRLDPVAGDEGCFIGVGSLGADSPDLPAGKRRFGLNIKKSLTTNELRIIGTDGNTLNVDVPGSVFSDYNEIVIKVTRGTPPTAQVFVNGLLQGVLSYNVHTGGNATDVTISSGSSGGTDRVFYVSNYGITIYKSDNNITVGDAQLNVDNADSVFPPGLRDYTISFSESITGSAVGNKFNVVALNNGGTLTVNNANPANPKALFNKLNEITVAVNGVLNTSGVNGSDGGNSYDFQLAPLAVAGNGDVTLYNPAFRMLLGSNVDDGTGAKIQTTGGLSSDAVLIDPAHNDQTISLYYEGVITTVNNAFLARQGSQYRYVGDTKKVKSVSMVVGNIDSGGTQPSFEVRVGGFPITSDTSIVSANTLTDIPLSVGTHFITNGAAVDVNMTQGTNVDALNVTFYVNYGD